MTPSCTASGPEQAPTCAENDDWDIRILRRVGPIANLVRPMTTPGPTRRVALVDTETTSTDTRTAEVIDIAVAILQVDDDGEIVGVDSTVQALRDPGMPIPEDVVKLTGITDAMVAGRSVSTARWEARLGDVDLIFAHNSAYDAPVVERLLPGLGGAAWACSMREVPWNDLGFDGAKLGHLLLQAGFFNDHAHRAAADVVSLAHMLAWRMPDGRPAMAALLDSAARSSVRIDATGAPYAAKDALKERRYRWDPVARTWWTEVAEADVEQERCWLEAHAECRAPAMTVMTARTRYR